MPEIAPLPPATRYVSKEPRSRSVARYFILGIVVALAGPLLASCAPSEQPSQSHDGANQPDDGSSPEDEAPTEPVAFQAMPATDGCPPGFLEYLYAVAEFVPTSVTAELGDDPIAQLPFFQHVCIGNGFPGAITVGFFGGDQDTVRDLGTDLATLGFYPSDELEGHDGYLRMSWMRDSPRTLVTAITWEQNKSKSVYGDEATALMPPSFSAVSVGYLDEMAGG